MRRLLLEGGGAVNYAFLSGGLVDELFLTLAPKLSGDAVAPTIVSGPPELAGEASMRTAKLLSADVAGDELFLRYSL